VSIIEDDRLSIDSDSHAIATIIDTTVAAATAAIGCHSHSLVLVAATRTTVYMLGLVRAASGTSGYQGRSQYRQGRGLDGGGEACRGYVLSGTGQHSGRDPTERWQLLCHCRGRCSWSVGDSDRARTAKLVPSFPCVLLVVEV